MLSTLRFIILLCVVGLLLIPAIFAAELSYDPYHNAIIFDGDVTHGDTQSLEYLLVLEGHHVDKIVLNSEGGVFMEGANMGLLIQKFNLDTYAYRCYSSCAYMWLAGQDKFVAVQNGGKVEIHAPYEPIETAFMMIPDARDEFLIYYAPYLTKINAPLSLTEMILKNAQEDPLNSLFDVLSPVFDIKYNEFDFSEYKIFFKEN